MAWTLITGGAKGLGADISYALAAHGHPVIIHYRKSFQEAKEVAKDCKKLSGAAEILQADLLSPNGVSSLLEQIESKKLPIANLINNVGNFFKGSPLNTPAKKWQELFQTNLHAPLALIQGLAQEISLQKGSIINIGTAGVQQLRADAKYTAYTLTKTSLYLLTKALAKELSSQGVRVNMVSPGEMENSVTLSENFKLLPMGRAVKCKEVAAAVLYLLSKESCCITGQNIEVAGGFLL